MSKLQIIVDAEDSTLTQVSSTNISCGHWYVPLLVLTRVPAR
jgi:hypothetical protein